VQCNQDVDHESGGGALPVVFFVLDVFFAVGSAGLYMMALADEDRFLAGYSAISFALSCVGSVFYFERLVF
jgi:hypothetical protein